MADIISKINAAFTLDEQEIIKTFQLDSTLPHMNWEPYDKQCQEAFDAYHALVEAGANKEAEYYLKIVEDCLGPIITQEHAPGTFGYEALHKPLVNLELIDE